MIINARFQATNIDNIKFVGYMGAENLNFSFLEDPYFDNAGGLRCLWNTYTHIDWNGVRLLVAVQFLGGGPGEARLDGCAGVG